MKQVLWAIGMVIALATTALLIADLYPGIWRALLDERVTKLIALVVALTVITILIVIGGASLEWTRFGEKKLWDWQTLLFVPLTVALIASLITLYQATRQQEIETSRFQAARELEEQRADDAVLQAYLDQMSLLMLEQDLYTAEAGSEISLLARARTLTVLSQLEASPSEPETGKEQIVEFLIEAELVHRKNGEDPVISLEETNLRGVDLDREDLHSVNLKNAVMHDANLEGANLEDANLEDAKLMHANLREANLYGANLENTRLDDANLEGATMPNGQKYEDWLKDKEGR
jgi:hypothetical protein